MKNIIINHNKHLTPEDVLRDGSLSGKQKMKALQSMEDNQKALLRADDENMCCAIVDGTSPVPADALKAIQSAERRLASDDPGSVEKGAHS